MFILETTSETRVVEVYILLLLLLLLLLFSKLKVERRVSILEISGTNNLISWLIDSCILLLTIYLNLVLRDF